MIIVQLNPIEALLFEQFRRYQESFKVIVDSGALDISNGSATLTFDSTGKLCGIEVRELKYRAGK